MKDRKVYENYYYNSELDDRGFMRIQTIVLYDLFDKEKIVILEGKNISRIVEPFDYEGFVCEEDYKYACFKPDLKQNRLDAYNFKLLQTFHNQWYNILYDMFNSVIFVQTLQKAAQLRQTGEIKTLKEDQLNIFQLPIHLTKLEEFEYHEIWKDFLEKCKIIQDEVILNRKKFDV